MWWRRGAKGTNQQDTGVAETAGTAGAERQVTPTVTLRPMTEAEYTAMRAYLDEGYAQEVARAMDISLEEGRAAAAKQLAELLPSGLASEGHYFWKIVAEEGDAVGDLWTFIDPQRHRAFIYFIGTDEAQRGKGYGRAAMLALEAAVRPLGADHIDLNVFGENTTARRLYESLGYEATAINMRKRI